MPVPFTCPHCGASTEVDDQFLGQSGPCYSCGKTVTVPYTAPPTHFPVRRYIPGTGSAGILVVLVAVGVVAALALIGILVALVMPVVSTASRSATRIQCPNNLKQIGLAMQLYQQRYGTYPPAYVADKNGKPMHSWRVLLLPFLEHQWLYDQYDFSQPWDSPQNINLTFQMPAVYACPADPNAQPQSETSYLLIVGPRTMFPNDRSTATNDISDGLSNTIMVVETRAAGISWLEPKDLDARQITFLVNGGVSPDIGSYHAGGVHVLMADGTVRFLSNGVPAEFMEALSTASGGESVSAQILDDF
jgi:prepilin-type processing-associated H-X9-DG protein